jgi:TfoX/Sxy family transcriptional regulator of competence genes
MATSLSQMEYIAEQLNKLGVIRYKKMFGEYGVYCDEIFFALVCDDRLFVKTVPAGKNPQKKRLSDEILSRLDTSIKPFPTAKNHAHIPEEIVENTDELIPICREVLKILA